jgi:serpin B
MLPRFSIVSSHSLVEPLQSLGIRDAFDAGRADFSGMSQRRPLFIQTAEQTCLVEVNEEGTVAAAATHIGFGCSAAPRLPRQQFHADRPFLFLIRENSTGTVLFVGRVTNPASGNNP